MVEILPYTEDDEDPVQWVPLNAGAPATGRSAAAAGGAGVSPEARKQDAHSEPCTAEQRNQMRQGRGNAGPKKDDLLVDDAEDSDDDGGWQKLSSPSRREMQEHASTRNSASSAVARSLSWSLGNKLISHLTSTPTTAAAAAVSEVEDEASESDIVWHRPDELEDDIFDRRKQRASKRSSIEEEYDDVRPQAKKAVPRGTIAAAGGRISQSTQSVRPKPRAEIPECGDREEEPEHPPFRRISDQQPQPTHAQEAQPKPTIKAKLQEKLIHDPLRALPLCFLRHLYRETKQECTRAWEAYVEQNDLHAMRAPLTLLAMVALFGVALIGKGLLGLGIMALRASLQMTVSFCAWWVRYSWAMANQLVWMSTCASLLLGTVVWLWIRFGAKKSGDAKRMSVPSISGILPWVVAVASPSLLEAIVIVLSLQTYMGVLGPESRIEDCILVPDDDAVTCSAEGLYHSASGVTPTLAFFALALLVAAANFLVVSAAAKMLDKPGDGTSDEKENASSASSVSSNMRYVQRNLGLCHTVSIGAFALLAVVALLLQALYIHFRDQGGSISLSLANGIGKGGWNVSCIGLGIAVLVALWNVTMGYITSNGVVFDGNLSFGDISRIALKKAVIEISSQAVWSSDDAGSGLLGILSDDDGALRVAILEWAIDRWAASSASSDQSPSSDNMSPANESDGTDTNAYTADSDSSSAPSNANASSSSGPEEQPESGSGGNASANSKPILPSYESLQNVINQLDADETLIPTIESYRAWVYSLPPSENAAMSVALWKMCPASAVLGSIVLWLLCKFALKGLFSSFAWLVGSSLIVAKNGRGLVFVCTVVALLSPVVFLEVHRVRQWWPKTLCRLQSAEDSTDVSKRGDLAMALLRADADPVPTGPTTHVAFLDVSSLLLRIWHLLLESISVLEQSVPVVRCATVAGAAADLTSNTFCLVDLALEIKKHGLVGGAGLMIWDAFNYHLSKELEHRQQETGEGSSNHEDLGGQYTGAMVNAGRNLGKMTHNISCLMEQRGKNESASVNDRDEGSSRKSGKDPPGDSSHVQARNKSEDEVSGDTKDEAVPTTRDDTQKDSAGGVEEADGNSPSEANVSPTQPASTGNDRSDNSSSNESQDNTESDEKNDNGPVPWLIGGGLAVVGAVAGIALHAANNGNEDEDKKKKDR